MSCVGLLAERQYHGQLMVLAKGALNFAIITLSEVAPMRGVPQRTGLVATR